MDVEDYDSGFRKTFPYLENKNECTLLFVKIFTVKYT